MTTEGTGSVQRKRIELIGFVQGVGFRPHVAKLASALGLVGWVRNGSSGVTIEIQGAGQRIDAFLDAVRLNLPPLARIDSLAVSDCPANAETVFIIAGSSLAPVGHTPVPADIAVCDDCLSEFHDPCNRRYRFPFINCTNCGPRFTIIESLPYDRPRTTMKKFAMCRDCHGEYESPGDRRFHAQPIACPACGPTIWFAFSSHLHMSSGHASQNHCARGQAGAFESPTQEMPRGEDAVRTFHNAIADGCIVAVKGIGGFHLACDATNAEAVARLRSRKGRIDKPLAIMLPDLQACRESAHVSAAEAAMLESRERPIVLLRKRDDHGPREGTSTLPTNAVQSEKTLAASIAPGQRSVGVLLPYSALHTLLLETRRPLVMTSGNLTDEPIVWENAQALDRLGHIADAFLFHDRPIRSVCDDSVAQLLGSDVGLIRRSRGYAPLPLRLANQATQPNGSGPQLLAVGGEIKSTFCIASPQYAYLSQHIGDLENLETLQALQRNVEHYLQLLQAEPVVVACDMHPGYASAQWARGFAAERHLPLLQVQHHHAHLAALACEHRISPDDAWLGICFDGTGYGTDGTIWGGELLLVRGSHFERLTHLATKPLLGGDAGIAKPYRIALGYLASAGIAWDSQFPCVQACTAAERNILRQQLERGINCPLTSSMGRCFDAVAALIGIRQQVSYEAQAAMELEALAAELLESADNQPMDVTAAMRIADRRWEGAEYRFALDTVQRPSIHFDDLLAAVCEDARAGVPARIMAAKFHLAVARLVAELGAAYCARLRLHRVGLSGGVFQNRLLLSMATAMLDQRGIEVLVHREVPTNDGGLALGQAWIAAHRLKLL